jgi:hypothetical protein
MRDSGAFSIEEPGIVGRFTHLGIGRERCSGRRPPLPGLLPELAVLQDLFNDFGLSVVVDQRDHSHHPSAVGTFQRVNFVNRLDEGRPRKALLSAVAILCLRRKGVSGSSIPVACCAFDIFLRCIPRVLFEYHPKKFI